MNIDTLEKTLEAGTYDAAMLRGRGILTTKHPVKLLGRGTVSKKFELTVDAVSKSAMEAVAKAGGKVTIQ